MKATHLQVDYLTEPLGISSPCPRFYWNCDGGRRQTAYQIIAQSSGETVWDSGKLSSSAMSHIPYGGRPLHSRERIVWQVQLWDEADECGPISESWFEMGLLEQSDWKAKWISGDTKAMKSRRYPADYFQKQFSVGKAVASARLYITACGVYEAWINERRVGDFVLAPGCTDYRKRLHYQTYDVTALIKQENTLNLQLGDGWFRGSLGAFGQIHVYGRRTSVLAQLEIRYADGTEDMVCTDGSWQWSNDGPVRFNDLQDGETYDAGMRPTYAGRAREVEEHRYLTASHNVPIREKERFIPKRIQTPSGKTVLDFGQNLAGFLTFRVHGKKGQPIRIVCGEVLDENGELTQKNFQEYKFSGEFGKLKQILQTVGLAQKFPGKRQPTPKQQITFLCSGGEDVYKSAFCVFGFRYAQVDTEVSVVPEDFEAIAVYSDLEQTGHFTCSSEKVNRLFQNTLWSMKSNFLDVPTDCPTRERLGWTGDAQVFFDTGAYLMNTAPFFSKWMADMVDSQSDAGTLPAVIPYAGMDILYNSTGSSAGWGCAAVLIPYRFWKRYNDRATLERFYPMARKYAMFMLSNLGHADQEQARQNPFNEFVYEKGRHLGEWLEPVEFSDKVGPGTAMKQVEVSTAYFHYDMTRMAEMAKVLGLEAEAQMYRRYADGSRKAYVWMFLRDGVPDTDRQAKLIRPIALGLVDGAQKKEMETRLAKAVENRNYRIGTGFLSTPFALSVLSEGGYLEHAYQMLENELAPGWLYEVNQGATTIWENWEGNISQNHYSPGTLCQWLMDTVCGIRPCGENRFLLCPRPGGSLTYAAASYDSLYGRIESRWEKNGSGTAYTVVVPPNTTACITLPDGSTRELDPGEHSILLRGSE